MRTPLLILSAVAYGIGVAAIVVSWMTDASHLGLRLVASVLLLDQATLAFLYIQLPAEIRGIRMALQAGSALAIVAGIAVLVASALPHSGPVEIAMPAVGVMLFAHGAVALRYRRDDSAAETA